MCRNIYIIYISLKLSPASVSYEKVYTVTPLNCKSCKMSRDFGIIQGLGLTLKKTVILVLNKFAYNLYIGIIPVTWKRGN